MPIIRDLPLPPKFSTDPRTLGLIATPRPPLIYVVSMEAALRVALIIAALGFALWMAKYLQENPVESELSRLQNEVQRLSDANGRLHAQNERHRTLVRGLREDPGVLDRRARETLGMARSDELIVVFEEHRATSPTRP